MPRAINTRRNTELGLLIAAAVPVILLYAMYLLNAKVALSFSSLAVPIGLFAAFGVAHFATRRFAPEADPAILPLVFLLSGIGIAFVTRLAPTLAIGQVTWLFLSVAAMIAVLVLVPSIEALAQYKFTMGIVGVALLLLPMLIGTSRGGSKLWIVLGPLSFQPGELAKILIVLFLAAYLAENREMLSASAIKAGPLDLPRPRMLAPMLLMWGMSLLVVVFERDLGSALLFFTFFVIMLYVCTGRVGYVLVSILLLAVGGVFCYHFFGHVQTRVQIWLNPFKDPSGKGLQIVQSLYSLADGGLDPRTLVLYAVTDRRWLDGTTLEEEVARAVEGGATMVQLREKDLGRDELLDEAVRLREVCHAVGVPLIVDDDVEVAVAAGADGVHVGQSDMEAGAVRALIGPDMILGVSAQTVDEALLAQERGADYLGVGAVFPTGSKDDALDVDRETLAAICAAVSIPVVAIGGIGRDNVRELAGTGIVGVATISALFARPDVRLAAHDLLVRTRRMLDGVRCALTIAGSDSSGGAGVQADLKTMQANGVFGTSAITALTAQNTRGVTSIMDVTPEFLGEQIDAVFSDIRPDAVKVGMVSATPLIRTIAERIDRWRPGHVVVDPVMVATSGARLISEDAVGTLVAELLPRATVITPNRPEAEVLWGHEIQTEKDMELAAAEVGRRLGCAVLVKGGHSLADASDVLWRDGECRWYRGRRVENPNTHGTGCTLSSAIASNLAKGFGLDESVRRAKDYVSGALAAMLDLGAGSGPMDHGFDLASRFVEGPGE